MNAQTCASTYISAEGTVSYTKRTRKSTVNLHDFAHYVVSKNNDYLYFLSDVKRICIWNMRLNGYSIVYYSNIVCFYSKKFLG